MYQVRVSLTFEVDAEDQLDVLSQVRYGLVCLKGVRGLEVKNIREVPKVEELKPEAVPKGFNSQCEAARPAAQEEKQEIPF